MQEIETDNGMTFILPFKLKYFYLYNEEYFKNKNIQAKISVLIKKDNIILGGGTTVEEIAEESKQLSIPYRYIYYIMESIRISLPFSNKKESNNITVQSTPSSTNATDTNIFTKFLNNFKRTPVKESNEGIPTTEEPLSAESTTPSTNATDINIFTKFLNNFKRTPVKESNEGIPNTEEPNSKSLSSDEILVSMDTSDTDKLEQNEDKLLLKIEILEKMKKIGLDELPYIKREKIANEIIKNKKINDKSNNENDPNEKGLVYENDNNEILVIGDLSLDDKKLLMLGIENTEVYNNLM
jgi:hypothetical protein